VTVYITDAVYTVAILSLSLACDVVDLHMSVSSYQSLIVPVCLSAAAELHSLLLPPCLPV